MTTPHDKVAGVIAVRIQRKHGLEAAPWRELHRALTHADLAEAFEAMVDAELAADAATDGPLYELAFLLACRRVGYWMAQPEEPEIEAVEEKAT